MISPYSEIVSNSFTYRFSPLPVDANAACKEALSAFYTILRCPLDGLSLLFLFLFLRPASASVSPRSFAKLSVGRTEKSFL